MKEGQVSDTVLINSYLSGCEKSFGILLKRHKSKVYSTIYLIVNNRELAEDLTQEVFIKFIDVLKKGNYNDEGKFLPWILRVAHNMCIDYIRKNGRLQVTSMVEDYEEATDVHWQQVSSAEDVAIKKENKRILKAMIKELPTEQRQVLIMRHFADMSFKEIADFTGVSINTALGRMRYAVNNLRKQMEVNKLAYDEILYSNRYD
ncbi:MAG: sigma-70 family RNA polymerase sigma factor [Cytophagales bacterium]